MKCIDGSGNVKVYNLTANKTKPEWQSEKKKKKKTKRDDDDLLQDFDMPDISTCIGLSPDGQFLVACGTYKPVMKCYDLTELSLKFERCMDAEVITFKILSEHDFSKMVFLQECRYLEFHSQGGRVHRARVPRFGRDLACHYPTADLYIAASGSEIYRLNLFQGRFLNSIDARTSGVNKLLFNTQHGLLTCGTDDGFIQAWDPRTRTRAGLLDCGKHMMEHAAENFEEELRLSKDLRITSLAHDGPFNLAVGNKSGQILMYDMRCNSPYLVKDHYSRAPIRALHFHSSGNVFSMAPKVVKIWDKNTGEHVTSIEGEVDFNDMVVVPDSGLAFFAAEDKRMKAYFMPSVGPAPSWCGHLDAMTEEMEEDEHSAAATQFDDYTFVTKDDLIELGLKDLIGSGMLRAVMHGYYINTATYNKAKQLANPVKPQNVLKKKVKETIAEQNTHKLKTDKVNDLVNQDVLAEVGTDDVKKLMGNRFAEHFTSAKAVRDVNVARELLMTGPRNKKQMEAFKKRQQEMVREEEDFKATQAAEAEDSDRDSVMDYAMSDSEESSSEDERGKSTSNMFSRRVR